MLKRLLYELTPRKDNLSKYDIIIIGNRRGAQLGKLLPSCYSTLLVNSTAEEQILNVFHSRNSDPKRLLDASAVSFTDGVGIKSTAEDYIELQNGRRIEFERLLKLDQFRENFDSIQGLKDSLADPRHPVYSRIRDPRVNNTKNWKDIFSFREGDFFFYIPKYPYNGYDAIALLRLFEKIHNPNVTYHIVSPNEQLIDQEWEQYQTLLQNKGIKLHLGADIESINKEDKIITIGSQSYSYDCVYFHGAPTTFEKGNISNDFPAEINNITREFQGQNPFEIKEQLNVTNYYIGNFRVRKFFNSNSKLDQFLLKLTNTYPLQVGRYFWQAHFKHYLYFANEIYEYYILGNIFLPPQQVQTSITIKDYLNQTQAYQTYPITKQVVDEAYVQQILADFKILSQAKKVQSSTLKVEEQPIQKDDAIVDKEDQQQEIKKEVALDQSNAAVQQTSQIQQSDEKPEIKQEKPKRQARKKK